MHMFNINSNATGQKANLKPRFGHYKKDFEAQSVILGPKNEHTQPKTENNKN